MKLLLLVGWLAVGYAQDPFEGKTARESERFLEAVTESKTLEYAKLNELQSSANPCLAPVKKMLRDYLKGLPEDKRNAYASAAEIKAKTARERAVERNLYELELVAYSYAFTPTGRLALYQSAMTHLDRGRYFDAVLALNEYVRLYGNAEAKVRFHRQLAYVRMGRPRPLEANLAAFKVGNATFSVDIQETLLNQADKVFPKTIERREERLYGCRVDEKNAASETASAFLKQPELNLLRLPQVIDMAFSDQLACLQYGDRSLHCTYGGKLLPLENTRGTSEISLGKDRLCAIREDGTPYCTLRSGEAIADIEEFRKLGKVKHVAVGDPHACFILEDDSVSCLGEKKGNQPRVSQAKKIIAGTGLACAILKDESLTCWGPQLPEKIPKLGNVKDVVLGNGSGCVITDEDAVECFGRIGERFRFPLKEKVKRLFNRELVFCAIKKDDTVACWSDGILEERLEDFGKVKTLSMGANHGCVITEKDELKCASFNPSFAVPRSAFKNAGPVSRVASGVRYSCAIKMNGELTCVGGNRNTVYPTLHRQYPTCWSWIIKCGFEH